MANKSVILTARCKWAKVLEDQLSEDKYSKKWGGSWMIDLIFDGEESKSMEELIALGLERAKFRATTADNKTKKLSDLDPDELEDSEIFMRVARKFSVGEDKFEQGPPNIIARDGSEWDQDEKIGNGSLVRVAFDFFGNGDKQGVVLSDVQVLEHVPYGKPTDTRGALGAYDEDVD